MTRNRNTYLQEIETSIQFHEAASEYEATLPTNPSEYEDQEWDLFIADAERDAS